jgi:D-arabinose 1-dehydrogenase-like Zn-dependent alcohol dehydrogenase
MPRMKVAQIPNAGADFELVEREIPKPGPGHVRIRVQACGVCHSDILTKEGGWPDLALCLLLTPSTLSTLTFGRPDR